MDIVMNIVYGVLCIIMVLTVFLFLGSFSKAMSSKNKDEDDSK